MSAYVRQLQERTAAAHAQHQAQRAEHQRTNAQAARERLTPLDDRLTRLLATIPMEVQREGFSLASLQASVNDHRNGTPYLHPKRTPLPRVSRRREGVARPELRYARRRTFLAAVCRFPRC
jgi:hypothetical protein